MRSQPIVLIICLGAVLAAAHEQNLQKNATVIKNESSLSNTQIRRILEENGETLKKIDIQALGISNSQKGIKSKLKDFAQDLSGIKRLEVGLKNLELGPAANFQFTASGIKNLTANIKAAENKTEKSIIDLGKVQQEIKQVLIRLDANQTKYERDINEVSKLVQLHIAGLDNLLRRSVLKELVNLVQAANNLEHTQRIIEYKVAVLDELGALSGITVNKVLLLEQGVRSLNTTQQRQLTAIGQTMSQVDASTWQIDNKLGVLLSTQKNIERALEECKKCKSHPKTHYQLSEQQQDPSTAYGYGSGYE